jgi:hypothetical protein
MEQSVEETTSSLVRACPISSRATWADASSPRRVIRPVGEKERHTLSTVHATHVMAGVATEKGVA